MNIELMMLQVLDDPTGVRIIVQTSYPDFSAENGLDGNAYFMLDRSNGGDVYDADGKQIEKAEVYDFWRVSDSIGQTRDFNSNGELIELLDSIKGITTRAWVESF